MDPASRGRSQHDGKQLRQSYRDLGLEIFDAKNEVESGIANVSQRLVSARLKVFSTCMNFQKEYMLYRRNKNGKIVKEDDHLLDCLRYLINNMKYMSNRAESIGGANIKVRKVGYDI